MTLFITFANDLASAESAEEIPKEAILSLEKIGVSLVKDQEGVYVTAIIPELELQPQSWLGGHLPDH